jgi:hypothetical protein
MRDVGAYPPSKPHPTTRWVHGDEAATSQETPDGLAVNWFAGTVTYSACWTGAWRTPLPRRPRRNR